MNDVRLRKTYYFLDGSSTQSFYYQEELTPLKASMDADAQSNKKIAKMQIWMEMASRRADMSQEQKYWDDSVLIYERVYPFRGA
jgi:hypothetical protein